MPIYELGYRAWAGERVPAIRRWLAITRTECAIAYRGSKLLRRALVLAWMPLLYFGPLFFAVGWVADQGNSLTEGSILAEMLREFISPQLVEQLHEHPGLFLPSVWALVFFFYFAYVQSFLAMIVLAIAGPPLVSKDLRSKAFLLYFSKPIGYWEYYLGKLGAVLVFLGGITLLPALFLYLVSIIFSPAGTTTLFGTGLILARIVAASLVISLPLATVVLLLSSLTRDRRIATFGWMALWIMGEVAFRMVSFEVYGARPADPTAWSFLLSLREVSVLASSGIFDISGHAAALHADLGAMGVDLDQMVRNLGVEGTLAEELRRGIALAEGEAGAAGPTRTIISFLVLALVTGIGSFLVVRRVSRPVRI